MVFFLAINLSLAADKPLKSKEFAVGPLLWVEGNIIEKSIEVIQGQTLMNVAQLLGANRIEADKAIKALSQLFNVRKLQIGQKVTAQFDNNNHLLGFKISINGDLEIAAFMSEEGKYQSLKTTKADRERFAAEAEALRIINPPISPSNIEPRIAANNLETITEVVRKGDTVLEIAMRLGAKGGEALSASKSLGVLINLRHVNIGQRITAVLGAREGDTRRRLLSLSIELDNNNEVAALLNENDMFDPISTTVINRQKLVVAAVQAQTPILNEPQNKLISEELVNLPETESSQHITGFDHKTSTLIISRGDTLIEAAISLGASQNEAYRATKSLAEIFNPEKLKVGQIVTATFGKLIETEEPRLIALTLSIGTNSQAAVFISESGQYTPHRLSKNEVEQLLAGLDIQDRPTSEEPAPETMSSPPTFDWVTTIDRTITVNTGDTLMEAVVSAGATPSDAYEAIQALTQIFDPRRLQAGQSVKMTFAEDSDSGWDSRLLAINVIMDVDRNLASLRSKNGDFSSHEIWKPLSTKTMRIEGPIENSLFLAAERGGVPMNIIMELIRIYSWDVDFQRDIQKGDRFEIFFEMLHDETGESVKEGNILYAGMSLSGIQIKLYRYETPDGIIDYYNKDGNSVRKALLRTPINGARLSSNFGMRKHPIQGYTRMHKGVDFAAPTGTPIKAAGDGVVEVAGTNGGYGKYIRIRHNSEYKTAYAHLSRYGAGIHSGVRVRQGQTIGYVGSTGASTGPHLHYEILKGQDQVNPMTLKLPDGKRLQDSELDEFKTNLAMIDQNINSTDNSFSIVEANN